MVAFRQPVYITQEEYLRCEREAETKNEYFDGEIVAMAGASPTHNRIAFNLAVEIGSRIKGNDCAGYSNDQRVKVEFAREYVYPDVVVVCGEARFEKIEGLETLLNPRVIVEVLSDTTEAGDRGRKFHGYQTLETLTDYVLVSQQMPQIEHYQRQEGGRWSYVRVEGLDAALRLDSIGCELRLADIYAGVVFPPPLSIQAAESQPD